MANKDDYLKDYRSFFESFANTYNPHDQLPVKLGSYKLINSEVVGAIIDWTTQYLSQKKCPQPLLSPLIKIIIQEVRSICRKEPTACGFNPSDNAYEPLRFMQNVIGKTNEVCRRYLDNSKLCSLPPPSSPYRVVSVCAIKNSRRRMEDRHVIVHDLSTLFTNKEVNPSSYYAIFDGHAGQDAAAYSCAHLHQFLGESKHFSADPELALRDAFLKTDTLFNDKCKMENFRSGTTAVCALLRHKENTLYIAWVGDSQAVLVSQNHCLQCVQPHKPCREDEKKRIEDLGGTIIFWGSWRVNGQLAVSRAIGDLEYKPFVTAVPDITKIPLTGNEDFLILACDGLWDVISEQDAAHYVYQQIAHNQDDIEAVSERLVQLAKQQGSCDNISVIVVFLREPSKVAAEAHWATRHSLFMDTLDNANATNPFVNSNNPDLLGQKEGFVCKQNGTENVADFLERSANGKRSVDDVFDEDEDLGPETDVDCVDDLSFSPTPKNLVDEIVNNNPIEAYRDNKNEKATLEMDCEFETLREEALTPSADSVHDTSGLVDNVAESGEDSEDEWNYIKGDQAEKENIEPSESNQKISDLDIDIESDTMSQLNPNAAEFVPISPKRDVTSPVYQALMDDLVIAQSPKRFTSNNVDIKVPNPREFETEIKTRPGDLIESSNTDESDNLHNLSSQEIMENLLNGKAIEEIEFQPSLPKPNEFHFGPNSTPFSTPGKFMDQSTKAVIDDESNYLNESFNEDLQNLNKEENCMSLSFYQDEDGDLNKVQMLPENIDEYLDKPKDHLLAEDVTCPPTVVIEAREKELSQLPIEVEVNVCERLSPFKDNLSISSGNLGSQSSIPELQSSTPDSQEVNDDLKSTKPPNSLMGPSKLSTYEDIQRIETELSESPIPHETLIIIKDLKECPSTKLLDVDPSSQLVEQVDTDVREISPIPSPMQEIKVNDPSHIFTQSPVDEAKLICEFSVSPVPELIGDHSNELVDTSISSVKPEAPIDAIKSPISSPVPEILLIKSPLASPVTGTKPFLIDTSVKSPISSPIQETVQFLNEAISNTVTSTIEFSDELIKTDTLVEPEILHQPPMDLPLTPTKAPSPQIQSPISPTPILPTQSPHPVFSELDSPVDDITSSIKDSPLVLASPTDIRPATEIFPEVIHKSASLVDNVSPRSVVDTESVATTDVNSFLERSLVPDMASPLSGDETQALVMENVTALIGDLEIKTEVIAPEFPIQTVTTPSQESKSDDIPLEPVELVPVTKIKEAVKAKSTSAVTKKAPTKTAAPKPLAKAAPSTKSLPSKTATTTKLLQAKTTTTSLGGKTLGAKPSPKDIKPAKVADKKPLSNGDAKSLAKKPTVPKTMAPSKVAPPKLSPAKVGTTKATPISTRTSLTTATKSSPKLPTARPSPTTVKQTKTPTTMAPKSTTSTLSAKPKTTIPPAKPKTLLSSKPAVNAPDAAKQIKESTNKQLTNSSANRISPGKPLTTTIRKANLKPATQTKTTLDTKKPAELVRYSAAKPKTITAVKKNVTNGVKTTITASELIKDVSPVMETKIVDNSQLLEVSNTD